MNLVALLKTEGFYCGQLIFKTDIIICLDAVCDQSVEHFLVSFRYYGNLTDLFIR